MVWRRSSRLLAPAGASRKSRAQVPVGGVVVASVLVPDVLPAAAVVPVGPPVPEDVEPVAPAAVLPVAPLPVPAVDELPVEEEVPVEVPVPLVPVPLVPVGVTVPAGVSPALAVPVELVAAPWGVAVGTMLSPPEMGVGLADLASAPLVVVLAWLAAAGSGAVDCACAGVLCGS